MKPANTTLRINMAMTLDGKTTLPEGGWGGMTSVVDRSRMDTYRFQADALILGKKSVIKDNPNIVPRRASGQEGSPPLPVMVCRSSLPPSNLKLFQQKEKRPLLLIARSLAPDSESLEELCDIKICSDEELEPEGVLNILGSFGCREILLEGGPTQNYAYLTKDLVDVLYLTLLPFIIGQADLFGILNGPSPLPNFNLRNWRLASAETIEDEIFLEYRKIVPPA